MFVSAEISYYPLSDEFSAPIDRFIELIENSGLDMEAGAMSTVISGEYSVLMKLLTGAMGELMADYPSVFTIKLSNTCMV